VLDTNVVSRMSGPNPDNNVTNWLAGVNDSDVFFSVVVIMELRKGIERERKKKNADLARLSASEQRLKEFVKSFWDHFIPADNDIAEEWGKLIGERDQDQADMLIAATANVKHFTVVTRNVSHFENRVKNIIDPFKPVKTRMKKRGA